MRMGNVTGDKDLMQMVSERTQLYNVFKPGVELLIEGLDEAAADRAAARAAEEEARRQQEEAKQAQKEAAANGDGTTIQNFFLDAERMFDSGAFDRHRPDEAPLRAATTSAWMPSSSCRKMSVNHGTVPRNGLPVRLEISR